MRPEGSFALLDALADRDHAGLDDLAVAAGLPAATAHGVLDELVARGAVWRKGDRYRIVSRLSSSGHVSRPAGILRAAARQPVRDLAVATDQATVVVMLPSADETVIVGGFNGELHEVLPLRPGLLFPHGNGLEVLKAAETRRQTATPPGHSRQEWSRLVTYARELGVAFQYSDLGGLVSCVTAPIRARSGEIVAGVSVGVFDICRLGGITPAVRRAADTISANLAKNGPRVAPGPVSGATSYRL